MMMMDLLRFIIVILLCYINITKSIILPLKNDIFLLPSKDKILKYKLNDIILPSITKRIIINNIIINIIDRSKSVKDSLINNIEKTTKSDSFAPFVAGLVGGLSEWIIGHPLDTIRVRVMSDSSTKSAMTHIISAISNPLGKRGILSLYRGSRSEILSSAFTGSFIFGCTSFIRNTIGSLSSKSPKELGENENSNE